MSLRKSRLTTALVLIIILAIVAGGLAAFGSSSGEDTKTDQKAGSQYSSNEVSTETFSYQKPQKWAKLSKTVLDSWGALSGIGLPGKDAESLPVATFSIKSVSATPKDEDELKNHSLDEIKKNAPGFKQLSSTASKVGGQTGQKFVYTFGTQDKTKQELHVVVYNDKTYFLLFSSDDAGFDSHREDFDKALGSFKFK